jgi:autotransporter-associated beta strand protein
MKTSCASLLVRFWLLPSLLLTTASAATLYWDGSATTVNSQSDNAITTSQSWVYGGNWDNGNTSAPVASWNSGNAAIFGGTAASQTIIVGTLTIGNLTFGQGPLGVGTSGTTYTISSGTLTLSNSTITANTNATISSVLAGSTGFTKSGVGTLTLTAANTHTGNTTVAGGVLVLENATGSVYTYNGGTISINGPSTLRVTGTGSSKRYDFLGKTFSFDSVGGGRIDLPSVGMNIVFALASNVTNTIVTNGGARNTVSGRSGFNLGGSSTGKTIFNVTRGIDATSDLEVAVQLWNGGAVVKSGDGILSLSSGNTYTGGTTVSGGTLLVQGSINAVTVATGATLGGTGTVAGTATISGTLAPGAGGIGTLTATSTLNLAAAATAEMGVKSASGVLSNDKLTGATTLTYGGTLVVARDPASGDFAIGDQFVLFSAAAYTGAFGNIVLPPLGTGLTWDVSRLTIDGSIGVVSSNATSAPVFNPPPGGYTGAQAVTLTGASGATIYYTTDGSAPTATSPHGLSPVTGITIPVDSTRTIKAYAAMAGQANSQVISGTYVTVSARTWITAGGGSWSVGTNWQNGGIPDGIGSFADFSKVNVAADATATLDGSRTLGTLWFGDSVPSHNWFLNSGTGGTITLSKVSGSPVIGVANQTATINAVLSGTTGFIKSGEGVLLLAGSSLFTGSLIVSQGELRTSTNFGAGDSNIILGDANTRASNIKWLFNGGGVPANSVEVTNQGTGTVTIGSYSTGTFTQPTGPLTLNRPVILQDGTGDRTSFQGKISGNPGTITLTGARITFSNASSDFTGTLIVSDGTSYQNNAAEVIPDGVDVTMNGSASQFRLNNCSETFNSLNGSGTVYTVVGANFTVTVGAGNGSGSFAGTIQDGTGALNFTKAGTGTQTLGGTCTHTGNTTVAAGTLLINGSVGSSPVTVAVGATLGGVGTLGRATTVNGTLAPGNNGVGALTITGTLTLAATATTLMEISKSGGTATFDRVLGVTSLTQGGTLTVTTSGEALQVGDSFKLFAATTYNGAFATVNLPAGYVWDTSQLKTNGTIAVTAINHPPVFAGYAVATPYQKSVAILVRKLLAKASDPDGDALGVTAAGPAANGGTVVLQAGEILYTATNDFTGADTFPVTITDARGAGVIGTVTVTVGPSPNGGGAGANPPILTPLPDGKVALAFRGIPGRSYIVQRSASGLDNWVTLATIPADASGKVAYTDESPPAGSAFYRLGLP